MSCNTPLPPPPRASEILIKFKGSVLVIVVTSHFRHQGTAYAKHVADKPMKTGQIVRSHTHSSSPLLDICRALQVKLWIGAPSLNKLGFLAN